MAPFTERVANASIAIAALVVAGATISNVFERPAPDATRDVGVAQFVADWAALRDDSIGHMTLHAAETVVVEFGDLECPFCARFHLTTLAELRRRRPNVGHVFVHRPLTMHRFAEQAGRAAYCAAEAGQFEEFLNVVFRQQDSIGLASWSTFARRAGVPDSGAFVGCMRSEQAAAIVRRGVAFAERHAIRGTPTILIDGHRLDGVPSLERLLILIDSLGRKNGSGR